MVWNKFGDWCRERVFGPLETNLIYKLGLNPTRHISRILRLPKTYTIDERGGKRSPRHILYKRQQALGFTVLQLQLATLTVLSVILSVMATLVITVHSQAKQANEAMPFGVS